MNSVPFLVHWIKPKLVKSCLVIWFWSRKTWTEWSWFYSHCLIWDLIVLSHHKSQVDYCCLFSWLPNTINVDIEAFPFFQGYLQTCNSSQIRCTLQVFHHRFTLILNSYLQLWIFSSILNEQINNRENALKCLLNEPIILSSNLGDDLILITLD